MVGARPGYLVSIIAPLPRPRQDGGRANGLFRWATASRVPRMAAASVVDGDGTVGTCARAVNLGAVSPRARTEGIAERPFKE